MSKKTKFAQDRVRAPDRVHAMDNMMMFIISHVIRLSRPKIDKNGESIFGEGILHLFLLRIN